MGGCAYAAFSYDRVAIHSELMRADSADYLLARAVQLSWAFDNPRVNVPSLSLLQTILDSECPKYKEYASTLGSPLRGIFAVAEYAAWKLIPSLTEDSGWSAYPKEQARYKIAVDAANEALGRFATIDLKNGGIR